MVTGFLALRIEINGNNSFLSILNTAVRKVRDGVSHGKIAFPDVVKAASLLPGRVTTIINIFPAKLFLL